MELPNRSRVGWWLFVIALTGVTLWVGYSFVGMIVLGVFGYYATRPICTRVGRLVNSRHLAATITVSTVLVPILLVLFYTGLRLVQRVQQALGGNGTSALTSRILGIDSIPAEQRGKLISMLNDPLSAISDLQGSLMSNLEVGLQVVGAVFGGIVLLALSITLSYVLLARDGTLAEYFVELVGGPDTTAYAYATAVDADLESVFFGNLLFIGVMSVVAMATYLATNAVAPEGIAVPMVVVLGMLTGIASLIPIVVGKIIYVPVVAYLAFQAVQTDGNHLPFVGGVLIVYVLVLDLLPQSFIQPYLSGRKLDMILLLFAYLMGPILWGWYGFFLLPILVVLVFEAARIAVPELVLGEPLTPEVTMIGDVGTAPEEVEEASEEAEHEGSDLEVNDPGGDSSDARGTESS